MQGIWKAVGIVVNATQNPGAAPAQCKRFINCSGLPVAGTLLSGIDVIPEELKPSGCKFPLSARKGQSVIGHRLHSHKGHGKLLA